MSAQHSSVEHAQNQCATQQVPHAVSRAPPSSQQPPDAGHRSGAAAQKGMQHAPPSGQWWHPGGENMRPPADPFAAMRLPAAQMHSMQPMAGQHAFKPARHGLAEALPLPQLQGHMQRSPFIPFQPCLQPPSQQHARAAGTDSMQPRQHPGGNALLSAFHTVEHSFDRQLPATQHQQLKQANTVSKEARRLQARRTIYVCDIDPEVKEAALANLFSRCGKVVDCRLCSDPNSALRFAFIEFDAETAVYQAVRSSGMQLGGSSVRVMRSRTAMKPVKQDFLPRTHEERERCGRTVYIANIDGWLEPAEVRRFFSKFCGHVTTMRLLNSNKAPTQIAFVEFADAHAAATALDCSGSLLGSQLIRVAPSKTPIRKNE